jgi:hypothetical protein
MTMGQVGLPHFLFNFKLTYRFRLPRQEKMRSPENCFLSNIAQTSEIWKSIRLFAWYRQGKIHPAGSPLSESQQSIFRDYSGISREAEDADRGKYGRR